MFLICRNSQLVHNPHIRAKLAQLVLLIAGVDDSLPSQGLLPTVSVTHKLMFVCIPAQFCRFPPCVQYRESHSDVFASHTCATKYLLPALMSIFIDIEFTGESMEFEDKFRKP